MLSHDAEDRGEKGLGGEKKSGRTEESPYSRTRGGVLKQEKKCARLTKKKKKKNRVKLGE